MELGVPTTSNTGMLLASFSGSALAENSSIGGLAQTGCVDSRSASRRGASQADALRREEGDQLLKRQCSSCLSGVPECWNRN